MQPFSPEDASSGGAVDFSILDLVSAPFTLLRADHGVVYANAEAAAVLGIPASELVGRRLGDVIADGALEASLSNLAAGAGRQTVNLGSKNLGETSGVRVALRRVAGLIGLTWGAPEAAQPLASAVGGLADAVRRAGQPMALLSREGRWLEANEAMCAILGYDRDQLLKIDLTDLIDFDSPASEDWPSLREKAGAAAPAEAEWRLRRRDGAPIWVRATVAAADAAAPGSAPYVISLIDITLSKQQEARLRESEARLRLIVESLDDVFWISDPNAGRLAYVSPGYESLWEQPRTSLYADPESFLDKVVEDDREKVVEKRRLLAEGRRTEIDYRIIKDDGTTRWIRSKAVPVRDSQGALICHVGMATDVTESRQIQQLHDGADRLGATGESTAELAHDFNNLLAIINVNAGLLLDEGLEPSARRIVNKILSAAKLGTAITGSLLSVGAEHAFDPVICNLNKVVRDSYELIAAAVGASIKVTVLEAPFEVAVLIDSNKLSNALLNLAINARDAIAGDGELRIEVAKVWLAENDPVVGAFNLPPGPYGLIILSDTGSGMTPEVAARAFEPFFTTKAAGLGAGLGLPAVDSFARRSGGGVTIESAPGEGASVKIYLPLAEGDQGSASG
ncbi:MAG: PAS domain S-box protein [Devosia sp.]|nr:PAS domain S-box protein [Devosia sp.]